MKIDDNQRNVLYASQIGCEIEFFSNYSIDETCVHLKKLLNRKIRIMNKSHSEFIPTEYVFKLEPDFSGGESLIELVTGPLSYVEVKLFVIKMLKWIKSHGKTSDRCSIHFNVSFDSDKVGKNFMSHMNILKFILDFNENEVYEYFPKRRDTVYAKSIKYVVPANKYYLENPENISPTNFILPNTKYYGINFSKLIKNYLEFRYIGGENYEDRIDDILMLLDKFILSIYRSVNEKGYSEKNKKELKKILENHEKTVVAYKSLKDFKDKFPDIKVLTDLQTDDGYVSIFYPNIRDHIYTMLSESGLKKGYVNYDTDTGRIQLKGAKLPVCYMLTGIDVIDCDIRGTVERCDIFNSRIQDSEIIECNLFNNSKVTGSKLKNSYVNKSSTLDNCYVFGKMSMMNGKMKGGIFREGKITGLSKISSETEIIEFEKLK